MSRIAIVQDYCSVGAKAENLSKAGQLVAEAADQGAKMILFPELFLTGFAFDRLDAELAETIDGPALKELGGLARRHGMWIFMGFPEYDPSTGQIFDSLACLTDQGAIAGCYRKIHLFDREQTAFACGDAPVLIDTPFGRVGLLISYDIEFPELARCLALQGPRLLVVASSNMVPWCSQQEIFGRARAIENQVFLALANRVGREAGFHFCGGSLCVDPVGQVIAHAETKDASLLVAELAEGRRRSLQDSVVNYFRDRRPAVYQGLV